MTTTPRADQVTGANRMVAAAGAIALAAASVWWTAPRPAAPTSAVPAAAVVGTQPNATQPNVAAPTPRSAQATSPARPETPAAPAAQAARSFDAGQRAFIDPATGRLRPMEHDDVVQPAVTQGAAQRRSARVAEVQEPVALGVQVTVAVPESLDTFTVATKGPDGKVVIGHAAGPKAAKKMTTGSKSATSGAKEDRNDR